MKSFKEQCSKRVSFILVTKHRTNLLEKTLAKIKDLVKEQDELILIDGSVSEEAKSVIYAHQNLIAQYISEPDSGITEAQNKGILLARGEIVMILQTDDIIYPESFEKAINVMKDNPQIDLLVCGGTKQYGNDKKYFYVPPGVDYGNNVENIFKYGSCGVGFLYRRKVFAKVGLLSTSNLASDPEFALRCIVNAGKIKFCRINLFNHPISTQSISVRKFKIWSDDNIKLVKDYTSTAFYLKYRLNIFYHYHRKNPLLFPWRVCHFLLRKFGLIQMPKTQNEILWDGGFS